MLGQIEIQYCIAGSFSCRDFDLSLMSAERNTRLIRTACRAHYDMNSCGILAHNEGVAAGSRGSDKDLALGDLTGCRINDGDRLAGVVDEDLLASPVLLS